MIKWKDKIVAVASGRHVFILFLLCLLMFVVIIPEVSADIKLYSNGLSMLDWELFYTPEQVFYYLKSYGEEGRALYLFSLWTADFINALIYGLFFSFLIAWLIRNTNSLNYKHVISYPLIISCFDLFENIGITFIVLQLPCEFPILIRFVSLFTILKWLGLLFLVLLNLLGFIILFHKFFQKEMLQKNIDGNKRGA